MQHSIVGQWPLANRFSSLQRHCIRNFRKFRHAAITASSRGGLAACGSLVAGSSVAVVASAAAGMPEFGGSPKPPKAADGKSSNGKGPLDFGSPLRRCTDGLLVLNGLLFILQWASKDALMLWGAKINSLIAAGQLWRLLTSSFLHTSAFHLLINSHALATIGPHVELIAGSQRFMAVYLTSAVVGTTASFLLTPAPSVGASAALFGLGAALGMFYWRHRDSMGRRSEVMLQQLGLTLAINMAYSLASKRIDNWGHVGGLIGGAAVSWLLGPKLVRLGDGQTVDKPPVQLMAYKPAALGKSSSSSSDSSGVYRPKGEPS